MSSRIVHGIDHVLLAIPAGAEDSIRPFYRDVLGFEEIPKPPLQARRGGAWFRAGSVQIHLGVDPNFVPARKAHVALLVGSVDELIERCNAAGWETAEADPMDGYRRAFVFDPVGNRIELMQVIEPSPIIG